MLGPHLNSYDKISCKDGICSVSTHYKELPLPSLPPRPTLARPADLPHGGYSIGAQETLPSEAL